MYSQAILDDRLGSTSDHWYRINKVLETGNLKAGCRPKKDGQ